MTFKFNLKIMEFKKGDKVYYEPYLGCHPTKCQNGIVKRDEGGDYLFVVYNCGGNWDFYENFTAANTPRTKVKSGWIDDGKKP